MEKLLFCIKRNISPRFSNVVRIRKKLSWHWFHILSASGSVLKHCWHNNSSRWNAQLVKRAYNDERIWKNTLYAVIFGIIGIIASGLTLVSLFFGGIFSAAAFGVGDTIGLAGLFVGLIIFLFIAFIFYILEGVFIRRAFDSLATRSGVGLFRTGGLLLLIGAVLTIVLVGLFLIFIAWILILVAFFQIPVNPSLQQSQMAPSPPPF